MSEIYECANCSRKYEWHQLTLTGCEMCDCTGFFDSSGEEVKIDEIIDKHR